MRINNKHTGDDGGGGARRGLTDVYNYTAGILCAVLKIRCTKITLKMTYKNALMP